jgi:predicted amidohydrolase
VNPFRIALANIRFPATPDESIALAKQAIDQASIKGARIICIPECFVPGYRAISKAVPPPDPKFLERAWSAIAVAGTKADITVVLGTERFVDGALAATALVIDQDGSIAGFQDKVQIDVSEEGTYTPGTGRRVFQAGPLTFGVAICHEGWRYPETVRWAHGTEHTLCFTRTSTKRSPVPTGQRRSAILRIHFMRRRPCVAPPKTPVISQPSIARVPARRPRRQSSVRMGHYSATSPTARKDC